MLALTIQNLMMTMRDHYFMHVQQEWLARFAIPLKLSSIFSTYSIKYHIISYHFWQSAYGIYVNLIFGVSPVSDWWQDDRWTGSFCPNSFCLCCCSRSNNRSQSIWCTYQLLRWLPPFSYIWQVPQKPLQVCSLFFFQILNLLIILFVRGTILEFFFMIQ